MFFCQKPGDTLDYSRDWTDFLDGDTITDSAWRVEPAGPVVSAGTVSGLVTHCLLAGVAYGGTYQLINRITTGQGRIIERSMTIRGDA